MKTLSEVLVEKVNEWREQGYAHAQYPLISEILGFQREEDSGLKYLRDAQFKALETYWYLRLVCNTKPTFNLYGEYYSTSELLEQYQLSGENEIMKLVIDEGIDSLWSRIREDQCFTKKYKLNVLQEVLNLSYPSYIFALAMGAGKTVLIGAIIATEFAMAGEYPDDPFIKNALVFAPGKTIIESLKELVIIPYEKILPSRLYKEFVTSLKLTVTRDGEKDIPVIKGSAYNVVVTNIEKIRIQKENVRKKDIGQIGILTNNDLDKVKQDVANLRLQTITSLPNLGVFSDEAHHTYGQPLNYKSLKKVRKTIDYIADKTDLICVINTTGTPYYKKQILPDVVYWYGLSEGIRDGILKDVSGNILSYGFDSSRTNEFIKEVVTTFFKDYKDVTLPNGSKAKLAIYFPQNDDLEELRPYVEANLPGGIPPTTVLRNTERSTKDEVEAFNRLNDPSSQYRVILLVSKGTEGWNCPSLFSCALARKIRSSSNLVLQASTRCLRQVPGNNTKARIYLSQENVSALEKELEETFRESIASLKGTMRERASDTIVLRKWNLPPLVTKITRRTVTRNEDKIPACITFTKPDVEEATVYKGVHDLTEADNGQFLKRRGEEEIEVVTQSRDAYTVAVDLADTYRLNLWQIHDELVSIYPDKLVPLPHIEHLCRQLEEQVCNYTIDEEEIEVALALVKSEGFNQLIDDEGNVTYTAEITYFKDREHLIQHHGGEDFGFHYTPYDFDSDPEKAFFNEVLIHMSLTPDEVEDIYFTGALTDPAKTEFYLWYKDTDSNWRRYTPDFIIRKKNGKCLIVEVKDARWRGEVEAVVDSDEEPRTQEGFKALALKKWTNLNPDRLKYQIIFADTEIAREELVSTKTFINGDSDE